MGLDMSLFKKPEDGKIDYSRDDQLIYWRKVNCVHKFFVENVQDGEDDCGDYDVTPDVLLSLFSIIDRILNQSKDTLEDEDKRMKLALELLPPVDGFFFGSQEIDDWYFRDLEYTWKKLKEVISQPDFNDNLYVYTSSW